MYGKLLACTFALALAFVSAQEVTVCSSSSSVSGDPHFTGFNGQRFEFQGVDGGVYNLFSAPDTQINGRFVGNSQWGDSRTFVQAVGFQSSGSRVEVACMNSTLAVTINGQRVPSNDMQVSGPVSVFANGHKATISSATVTVEAYKAKNSWSACYLNLGMSLFASEVSMDDIHGLIGQTASINTVASPGALTKYEDGAFKIEGSDNDYQIQESHLFGTTNKFNRYEAADAVSASRKLLGTARALLQQDCTACNTGICDSQPDGMHNCMIRDGLPECYDTDVNVFCAPSGCGPAVNCDIGSKTSLGEPCVYINAASCESTYYDDGVGNTEICYMGPGGCEANPACMPPVSGASAGCSTDGKNLVTSCGVNTGNTAECANSYTSFGEVCFDDQGLCVPDPNCMTSTSSSGPPPCVPSGPCDTSCSDPVSACTSLSDSETCNKSFQNGSGKQCAWTATFGECYEACACGGVCIDF